MTIYQRDARPLGESRHFRQRGMEGKPRAPWAPGPRTPDTARTSRWGPLAHDPMTSAIPRKIDACPGGRGVGGGDQAGADQPRTWHARMPQCDGTRLTNTSQFLRRVTASRYGQTGAGR